MLKLLRNSLILIGLLFSHNFIVTSLEAAAKETESGIEEGVPIGCVKGNFTGETFSFDRGSLEDLSVNLNWHKESAEKIHSIRENAIILRNSNTVPNFATFRIRVLSGDDELGAKILADYQSLFFASGGDTNFLASLSQALEKQGKFTGVKLICPGSYWSSNPLQLADVDLRRDIANTMRFQESITSHEKERIVNSFKSCIVKSEYFEEMALRKKSIEKLTDSCRSSLNFQVFTEESNTTAHMLGLINKAKKGDNQWHLNDLFGETFQLNFADSEQAIKAFIYDEKSEKKVQKIEFNLDFNEKLNKDASDYWILYKSQNQPKPETIELKAISDPLDKAIVEVFQNSGIKFVLEIASYYEMCLNCQATFKCDFIYHKNIQKKCLLMLIEGQKSIKSDLKSYIKGRLYPPYELSKSINSMMSLIVSHQRIYNHEGEQE